MTVVTKPQGCSSTAAAVLTGISSRTSQLRDMRPVLRSVMPLLLKPVCRRNISHSAANLLIAPCSMEHTDAYDLKPLNASVNAYSICPLKGPCCLQLPGPQADYSAGVSDQKSASSVCGRKEAFLSGIRRRFTYKLQCTFKRRQPFNVSVCDLRAVQAG